MQCADNEVNKNTLLILGREIIKEDTILISSFTISYVLDVIYTVAD